MANTVLGSTTAAKHAVGFNLSLLKGGTITQTIVGAIITGLVIASTVATIILVSVGVGYNPPVAQPDFATTFKRVPITVDVLLNDNDPRGGNLTLTQIVVPPKFGMVRILSRTQIVYQSNGAFTGNDTFSYEVTNSFMTANATVTVQVLNRPPQAVPIYKKVSKNAKNALIDIFNYIGDNDEKISDVDNDVLFATSFDDQKIISGNSDQIGSIKIDAYNGFLYSPSSGFNGIEKFNYTISDGNDTSSSTITLEVDNDPPTAVDDYFRIPKYRGMTLDVLANDFDINGDDFNITGSMGAGYGASSVSEKSLYYFTSGILTTRYSDSFEYTISDGQKESSAVVFIEVYNTEPTVVSKTVTIAKSSSNNAIGIEYSDPDGKDVIRVSKVSPALSSLNPPASLHLSVTRDNRYFECCDFVLVDNNNYTILFTPVPGTVYTQTLDVTMTDGEADSTGKITINVVNTPPVAVDDHASCNKNQQVLINVVANDYDENIGDTEKIKLTNVGWESTTTNGGSVSIFNDTHVLYTAPKNTLASDVATYRIFDQSTDSQGNPDATGYSTGKIIITIVNNPPVPVDDEFTISKGISTSLNVLINDYDPNDGPGSISTINSVTRSSVKDILATIVKISGANDTLSYLASNEEYTDYLTYDVTDKDGLVSEIKATVKLNVINNAPVANDDTYSLNWNKNVMCSVKENDEDINGDLETSTIVISQNPTNGNVEVIVDKVKYTPSLGFVGQDSFKYKLNDGSAANSMSNDATVTINVLNTAPIAVDDTATTHWRNDAGIVVNVLSNDYDNEGDSLSVTGANAGTAGTATIIGTSAVRFVPSQPSTGVKQVQYTITDGNMPASANINVDVTNTKPVAISDAYTFHWAAPKQSLAVLINDNDPDLDAISLKSVSGSTAAVKNGDSIDYTPKRDGVTDTFQYVITDTVADSDPTTVTVTFTNNDKPTASNVATSVHWRVFASQSNRQDFSVYSSTTDADNDSLTLTVNPTATGLSGSSCQKTTDTVAKVRINAPTKTIGTAACTFSVSDGLDNSGSNTATVTITNSVPTCTDMTVVYNPIFSATGQSFLIASSVSDADSNDIPFLVPTNLATDAGNSFPFDTFYVNGPAIVFKPNSTGERDYFYRVTDGVETSTPCNIKIIVSSLTTDSFDQKFDVHWNATSVELDILDMLPSSTIVSLGNTVGVQGTPSIAGGRLYFTPDRRIYVDNFIVVVSTAGALENVKVSVTTYNMAPTASVPTQTVRWGRSINIDLLQNYADVDWSEGRESKGTVKSINKVGTLGSVSEPSISGTVTYTAPNNVGADSFRVVSSDGLATVTYTVNINIVNSAPITNTKTAQVHWSVHKTGHSIDLSTGVTDPDSDSLTFNVVTGSVSPSGAGTVAMSTSPNAVATGPSTPYLGKFSYTYTASDSIATTPGVVEITVFNNMATPVADTASVHWRAQNFVLNPLVRFAPTLKDSEGDDLTIVSASAQKGGVSIASGSQTLLYNAPTNPPSLGIDVVTYRFTDGAQSLQNAATVVNVNVINTPPVAVDQSASGKWNTPIPVSLDNACTDADSSDVPFVTFNGVVSDSVGGTVAVSGKTATFTPVISSLTFSQVGEVHTATGSFKFRCTDGISTSNLGTVTVTITNTAPTGTGLTRNINRDYTRTTYDFTFAEIASYANPDVDGNSVSLQSFSSNDAAVSVSVIGTSIRLTTPRNVIGEKQISFRLFDGLHTSSSPLVFRANFVNSAPVCVHKSITLNKKAVTNLAALFEATDSNNDPISFNNPSGSVGDLGTLSGSTFTASATRSGSVTLTYTATDGQSTSAPCNIQITVVNRNPVANDITYQIVPVSNNLNHIFNYVATDADGDSLTYTAISNTCSTLTTALTISTSGAITFTRRSTIVTGECTMDVRVVDNNAPTAGQDTAVVRFIISSTVPAARDDRFQINQGQTIRIFTSQILQNDNDEYGSTSTLTFVSHSCPDNTFCHRQPRLVTVNGQTAIEVDSDQNTCQADKFRYTMRTALGAERTADVFIEFKNCFCAAKIDFVFLLDASGSVGTTNFNAMRDLCRRITGRMKIAEDAVKVSIIRFHSDATLALSLSSSGTLVNQTLTNMAYEAGWTAQIPGLRFAVNALRPANGGRPDAAKVIYILTDGLSNRPCTCSACETEWSRVPSIFQKTIQTDVINNNGMTTNQKNAFYRSMCAYKYSDSPILNGKDCGHCNINLPESCLPCSDAVPVAQKINTWSKRNQAGVVPNDPDNPYNGNQNVVWKIVAMAVGDAMNDVWGARQIRGMNYDPSRALTVSWTDLASTMNEIVDQSCNQVNVEVP